jgi:hypothetical protein
MAVAARVERMIGVLGVLVALLVPFSVPLLHQHGSASIVEAAQDPATITVYITRTGEKYHRGDCRYLRQSKIAVSLKEAVARGYGPCSVCKPPQM